MNIDTTSGKWYLVCTRLGSEGVAYRDVVSLGFGAYYPRFVKRSWVQGRRKRRVKPLFPAYLFVHVGDEQSLSIVKSADGVRGVVRFGDDYAIVPTRVVDALRLREAPGTGLHKVHEWAPQPNETVRVNAGPFEGLEGIFMRESGSDRVIVLLSILGRDTPIDVDETWVEKPLSHSEKLIRESIASAA